MAVLGGSVYVYTSSKQVPQTGVVEDINKSTVALHSAGGIITYSEPIIEKGTPFRVFSALFSKGNGLVHENVQYQGLENQSTYDKYIILSTAGAKDLRIVAVSGDRVLFKKCAGKVCGSVDQVDLDKDNKISEGLYYVENSYTRISVGSFDKLFQFKNSLIVVGDKDITEYDILSPSELTKTLVSLKNNETFSYRRSSDGTAYIEASLDGNVLKYSVYQDVDKSENPVNKQNLLLFNKNITLE